MLTPRNLSDASFAGAALSPAESTLVELLARERSTADLVRLGADVVADPVRDPIREPIEEFVRDPGLIRDPGFVRDPGIIVDPVRDPRPTAPQPTAPPATRNPIEFTHVQPGDLITAGFINGLIDIMHLMDLRLIAIEAAEAAASRPNG